MSKQKWTEKPMTWGGYFKLCGILYAISLIFSAAYWIAWFKPSWCTNFKEVIRKSFVKRSKKKIF